MLDGSGAFAGREVILDELKAICAQSGTQKVQLCVIQGQPGIGKSSILERLAKDIKTLPNNPIVAMARCDSNARANAPYSVFGQVLPTLLSGRTFRPEMDQKAQIGKILRMSGNLLKEFTPDLMDMVLPGASDIVKRTTSAISKKSEVDELVAQVISNQNDQSAKLADIIVKLSANRPILIMIDDAHLADSASLEVLLHLKQHHAQSPVILMLALRSSAYRAADNQLEDAGTSSLAKLLLMKKAFDTDLDQLGEIERRAFVNAIVDLEPNTLDAAFREQLFLRTDGHPLMTKELLKALVANGSIEKSKQNQWQTSGNIDWEQAPNDLVHALESRLQSFSEEEVELLRLASAFDGEIILPIIAKFLDRSEWNIVNVFTRHLQNNLAIVRETRAFRVGNHLYVGFRFREPLLREYLYQQLGTGEKMYIHDAISMALRSLFHDSIPNIASELFWHYQKAGRQHEAIELALEAVSAAMKLGALSEALMHIQLGLNVLDGVPEGEEKDNFELNFLVLKSKALRAREGWSSQTLDDINERVNMLAKRTGQSANMASVWFAEWTSKIMRSQIEESLIPAKQMLDTGLEAHDPVLIIIGDTFYANSLFWVGDVASAYQHSMRVLEKHQPDYSDDLIERTGFDPISTAHMFAVWSSYLLGDINTLTTLDSFIEQTADSSHAFTAVIGKMTLVWQASHEHDFERTIALAQELRSFSEQNEFVAYTGLADIFIGWGQAKRDEDHKQGLALLKAGFDTWFETSGSLISSYLGLLLSDIFMEAGAYNDAKQALDEAFEHVAQFGERAYEPDLWLMRGHLLQRLPSPELSPQQAYLKGLTLAQKAQQQVAELKLLVALQQCDNGQFQANIDTQHRNFAQTLRNQNTYPALRDVAKQLLGSE